MNDSALRPHLRSFADGLCSKEPGRPDCSSSHTRPRTDGGFAPRTHMLNP